MFPRRALAALIVCVSTTVFADPPRTVVLEVRNMTCSLCPLTVRKALEQVAGAGNVSVDPGTKTAKVTYDPARTSVASLAKASTDAGYPARARPQDE